MPRPKRNKELAEKFRGKKCFVCPKTQGTVGDHIITFGSRPDLDCENNIWALCVQHHDEKGKGLTKFINKYGLSGELEKRGYFFDSQSNKWRFPCK